MQANIYKKLEQIANNRCIEIIHSNFKSIKMKAHYVQNGDIEVIFLNESVDDPVERNFILAHELGHQELHKGNINKELYFSDSDYIKKLEEEADLYAGKLINKIIGGLSYVSIS